MERQDVASRPKWGMGATARRTLTRRPAVALPVPVLAPTEGAPRSVPLAARMLWGNGWAALRIGLDAAMLALAVAITLLWPGEPISFARGAVLLAFPPVVMLALAARGLYSRRLIVSLLDNAWPLVGAISVGTMAIVVLEVYLADSPLAPGVMGHVWGVSIVLVGGARTAAVLAQRWARRHALIGRPTLVVGSGLIGTKIARRLRDDPSYGLWPVGFLDDDPPPHGVPNPLLPVLGGADDLEEVAARTHAEHVVLAFSASSDRAMLPVVRRAAALGLQVSLVPRMFESINNRIVYESLGGIPVLGLRGTNPHGREFALKHVLDRVGAALVLLVASPLLLVLTISVALSSPGPVLFRQRRVGRDGREFELLKFRSMAIAEPAAFEPEAGRAPGGVEGEDRRTLVGRLMRRTSMDELPQLINVLRGDMSLVGPRPERPEFAERFRHDIERYGDRHRVKAGMTGWAQVNGLRGQTSIEDRAEWDNHYIEHWSLRLDLKILALTALAVLRASE
jgi:exopolysaccharide biosynthesis polyprenyl glycosylphosphotransferase